MKYLFRVVCSAKAAAAKAGRSSGFRRAAVSVDVGRSTLSVRCSRRFSGFTLVELLAVVGIIALIAGLIVATAGYANRKSLRSKAEAQLRQIELALELYKNEEGYYPVTSANVQQVLGISHTNHVGTSNNVLSLYTAITGYSITNAPPNKPERTSYFPEIKPDMIQKVGTTNYLVDPYGNIWGYFSAPKNSAFRTNQYNPRSYDLWSYGITPSEPTNSLICNWRQQ